MRSRSNQESSRHHILPRAFANQRVELKNLGVIFIPKEKVVDERNVLLLPTVPHALSHYWWSINLIDEGLAWKQKMGLGGLTGRMSRSELAKFEHHSRVIEKGRWCIDPLWGVWTFEDLVDRSRTTLMDMPQSRSVFLSTQ